ncbi:GroS Co-chaperonin GroES (HSP10) [uncultured Caudovirales phage]|uniref:GroS Co-chaperonin GroES (HSP10) n=1 Tax=uncultured Caudovirales phage TaxID=2100421 RepID=A0A6J5KH88_9CAUD|nr:GroS Co-chaperonin GroES (HSP10) [uncultured Caudovirales phage]
MNEVTNNSGVSPLGRAVLVRPYVVEDKTSGGIILTTETRSKDQMAEQRAVVVEIGPTAWLGESAPRAAIGDKILFSKWSGYQLQGPFDGLTYRVVNDSDIFMRITKEK